MSGGTPNSVRSLQPHDEYGRCTTSSGTTPLQPVDDQFAWDEGEGDRSRAFWLDAHTNAFTGMLTAMGRDHEMHPDLPVVFERFELLQPKRLTRVRSRFVRGELT